MNVWEKFSETLLPEKEHFQSHLNVERITDAVCQDEKKKTTKTLGQYHDLYVQINTLLLADKFTIFLNMYFKVYETDPARFLNVSGLAQ